jgi:3-hydroxyisobutyrate dehydrogenase-like beta-hydroxyacid dehydrogenase
VKLAFIGFGEVGRTCARTLKEAGAGIDAAYDLLFVGNANQNASEEEAARLGVRTCRCSAEAIGGADWIVSAVTAHSSLAAAEDAARHLAKGQVFIDLNSVSPGRKRAASEAIAKSGARYVDMAVMAPIMPDGHRTATLVAGPGVAEIAGALDRLGFRYEIVGENVGDATAVKMVRSIFVKGIEAVIVEGLLAGALSGTLDCVVPTLRKTFPGLDWSKLPSYNLERMTRHGIRRAAEMRESAATVAELGLDPGLVKAIAESQQRIGDLGLDMSGDLQRDLERLLRSLLDEGRKDAAQ